VRIFRAPKTEFTQDHYAHVMKGDWDDKTWGKEGRFKIEKAKESPNIQKYFTTKVAPLIRPTDAVLDAGCGNGMFLPVLSPMCRTLKACDVAPAMVESSKQIAEKFGLTNTTMTVSGERELPYQTGEFDVVMFVDVIHHIYYLDEVLKETLRVLRPGGRLILFEPNKLNPALALMCLMDRNEWGLLGLGRIGIYRKMFRNDYEIETMEYSGLLIGPDSPRNLRIVEMMNEGILAPLIRWLNPKLFMSMRKRAGKPA